jgi:hypothetical protein
MKKIIKMSLCALSIIIVHANIQSDAINNNQSSINSAVDQERNNAIQDRFQAKKNILNNRKRQKDLITAQTDQKQEPAPQLEDIYGGDNNPIHYAKETSLIEAVKKNDLPKVQELLQQKVDVNLRDLQGKTAYDYAIEKSKSWIILPSQRGLAQKISQLVKPYNPEVENPDGSMKEID